MKETIEKKSNVITTAIFSKSGTERYLLKMQWDEDKPTAVILMLAPSSADDLILDQTTMLCRNGAIRNGFGSISIVNLNSSIGGASSHADKYNVSVIMKECDSADCILVCFGRGTGFEEEKKAMLEALKAYKKKLYTIIDSKGLPFSHPLSHLAHEWKIQRLKET